MFTKRNLLILILLLFFAIPGLGQNFLKNLCKNTDEFMLQTLKPLKIYRQDLLQSECVFEFSTANQERVSISIEKNKTAKQSRKSVKSDLHSFLAYNELTDPPKFVRLPINSNKYWDDAFFYKSNYRDNFILLRKQTVKIVIISTDDKSLLKLENFLRLLKFEK